jgi:hypothetical protein
LRCKADERQTLEQLCLCINCPVLAIERVQCDAAWQVGLRLQTPWRDGNMHLVMSPP